MRPHRRSAISRLLTFCSSVMLLLSTAYMAAAVGAAAPAVNTGLPAVVDGNTAEWTSQDYFADMHRAAKADKPVESKLYLRYDCAGGVLYVAVIPVAGVTVLDQDDDNFVKFGNTDKKVDGNDAPPDATQPNFAYAPNGGGWEASFSVGQVSINNLNVHAQVWSGGAAQTSAVLNRAIAMSISCGTTPASGTATPTPEEDNASLNIRKVDDGGRRLAGAVFTVEGMEGTFTTNARGFFCITGLENDSVWRVTEIQAPEGYEIAAQPWQDVEVDDDGDCDSPDAVFVNTLADEGPREEDNAALKIRKIDDEGTRLADAVFTVEGMAGTFTTDDRGEFCITGLANDLVLTVTEIQAPAGYEIAAQASQDVEVDDDGDCDSPDAVFVNTLAGEGPTATPNPTPREGTQGGTPTPKPSEGTKGGNPTPNPRGGSLPDTAVATPDVPVIPAVAALVALMSLGIFAGAAVSEVRTRR